MIIISRHAKKEMKKDNITIKELENCLAYGKLIRMKFVKGRPRYVKELTVKDERIEKIVVIYTYEKENAKVITCYPRKRKNWQNWQKKES